MKKISVNEKQPGVSRTWLLVVFGFGVAAFLVRWAELTIPIVGTSQIYNDPREVFTTLGSAITGPVGGLVIGFLAGVPGTITTGAWSGIIAHIISGLLIGFLYKPISNRWRVPVLLVGWGILVAAYYYAFLIPTFFAAAMLIDFGLISTLFGENVSISQAYNILGSAFLPEVVATIIVTTVILIALPEKYRRPLW